MCFSGHQIVGKECSFCFLCQMLIPYVFFLCLVYLLMPTFCPFYYTLGGFLMIFQITNGIFIHIHIYINVYSSVDLFHFSHSRFNFQKYSLFLSFLLFLVFLLFLFSFYSSFNSVFFETCKYFL